MSSSTRVLVLGCLLDKPLNGYQVRRQLDVMGAEHWANVAFGSIYHGLGKMAEEGLLEVVESGKGGKTVYQITEAGRMEFHRLLLQNWYEVKPIIDPFQVALTFMDRLTKQEILDSLDGRIRQLRMSIDAISGAYGVKQRYGAPKHIDENLHLTVAMLTAQLDWAEKAVIRVENDELP
ncbi:PadR family transcriptional regulator [Nonomuraea aurantiaca]|uniref:PadR family transcriptional regulator n=1 Tax=Nonomuraea aurantiaca TaxID=2878562 RepID=UPI001CD9C4A7|nr:PadR family transcriptional regulator [Nonomuraea aurantiaca]MCA2221345.1 PadR family transcriptional regulator [Nonomuraea aurantiaca]